MTRFAHTVDSVVDLSASRVQVWEALSDPAVLSRLAPMVRRIDADGDIWHWQLVRIAALGASITPAFTEKMTLDDNRRIAYTHQPPPGKHERAGAEGAYELADIDGGTRVSISLTIALELALPGIARPAVHRIMKATMSRAAGQFATNLVRHLGARDLR
jgi:carbon monoxide dehydrogenase subunit G